MIKDNNGKLAVDCLKPIYGFNNITIKIKEYIEISEKNVEVLVHNYPKYIKDVPIKLLTIELCKYVFNLDYENIKYIPFKYHETIFEELEEIEI